MGSPHSITIIGGGLSGLSTAFHLSRRFPPHTGARIALVEKSQRLGGWVKSERVRAKDGYGHEADVLLESGPRTLRPASKAILELINLLNLTPSILTVPLSAPAARNRYLHLHESKGLTTIPSSLPSLLVSPLARILIPAILGEFWRTNGRVLNASPSNDESLDAFMTRHFGDDFARTFGSALIHGIYATDSRLLSVRAAFPVLPRLEESGKGSIVRGALNEMLLAFRDRKAQRRIAEEQVSAYQLGSLAQRMKGVSVYSFRDGMQTLTDALARYLENQGNVDIITGDGVSSLTRASEGNVFQIATESGKRIASSHIISALPLSSLHSLLSRTDVGQMLTPVPGGSTPATVRPATLPLPPFPHPALALRSGTVGRYALQPTLSDPNATSLPRRAPSSALPPLPHLLANPSSSVTVVNLVFPPSDVPIHPDGFGYLIPRPFPDYPSPPGSTLGILGTVFDSCALGGQDIPVSTAQHPPRFTKATVMLGGPYGDPSPDPQTAEFLPALLAALQKHLGREKRLPAPCIVRIRQHQGCIPTPTVGHLIRMEDLRAAVKEKWGENATVIGAGVDGVSVGDCVESGRRVALAL
ncbi:Protoporphyrinogen oxidase [Trametes meyenii]|nr:Protoporphyrinogen oxidase [Trametes meyenii]